MVRPSTRLVAKVLLAAGLVSGVVASVSGQGAAEEPRPRAGSETGAGQKAPASRRASQPQDPPLAGFDPLHHVRDGERMVSGLPHGKRAILTLRPDLQAHLEEAFARYGVPYGAAVVMEPDSGRVLAYVSHSTDNPDAGDLVRDATPPTASVFKVVTAAALVDAGVEAEERVCYGGGARRLTARDLEDDADRDRWCAELGDALGRSLNAVFAKLADRHLDRPTLERYAAAFGFGHGLPFDAPLGPSPAEVPAERLERARTAAGFWHMHMSPLHGALVASTIAAGGEMPRAFMVDRVVDGAGKVIYRAEPRMFRRVIPRATAQTVGEMMTHTVHGGTAHKWFFDPNGNAFLPDTKVAGKTGTLTATDPYRGYNWFVGFAPAEDPEVAVAALVVNSPKWRIKAGYIGREALRHALFEGPAASQ